MVLNLLAILVFVVAILAGMMLLWRRLPNANAAAVGEPLCVACGTPARAFSADRFWCPSCGRDARDLGLAAKKPGVLTDPFWRVVAFSVFLSFVALVATSLLQTAFHPITRVSSQSEYWGNGTNYLRLCLTANGTRAGAKGPFVGELDGDLVSAGGDLVTLQIHGPSFHYDVVNDAGRTLVPLSAGAFDEAAVLQWMAAAKLDPADPQVRGMTRRTYLNICKTLNLEPGPLPALDSNWMSGGSTGSSSNFERPPAAIMPASVMTASIVWLIGTWLILRPRPRKSPISPVAQEAIA